MEKQQVREHMGKVSIDLGKGAFNVLFVGALALYYGKEGEVGIVDVMYLMGAGLLLGAVFVYTGYRLLHNKREKK
jgi:hypothetical protein